MYVTFTRLGRMGRLGNQLFQVAATIGLAEKHGFGFCFPEWYNWDNRKFGGGRDIQPYFRHRLPGMVGGGGFHRTEYMWGYRDLRLTRRTDLYGHFQSERYFERSADTVRHHFEFVRVAAPFAGCAIHIRCGDYGTGYHPRLGADYYLPAMERLGASRYTVFTDTPEDVEWISKYADIRTPGHEVHDMQDFSLHESHIIGNSTWSWWGAWLGQGPTIAPKTWFGPEYSMLDTSDIIPERWILL